MSLEIWLPESARPRIAFRCTVPGCDQEFTEDERSKWQRHVGDCARRHMDRIRAMTAPKGPAILHEDFDPEVTAHLRQVGKRMIEERRLEMKPSERAGFS